MAVVSTSVCLSRFDGRQINRLFRRVSVLCAFCLWIILQSKFFHLIILRKIVFYGVYMGELKAYKYKYRLILAYHVAKN